MKHSYIYFTLFSAILLLSNSTNPPNGRTGAPGESSCNSCHTGNAPIQGLLTLEGIPDKIQPGITYDITVKSTVTSGQATRAGFQWVALDGNNQNTGTLSDPGANVAFELFNNRRYAEHRPAKSLDANSETSYHFKWTAPENPQDSLVSFYAVSVLANGNGSSSGDRVVNAVVQTSYESSSNTVSEKATSPLLIYPNPASSSLWIKGLPPQPTASTVFTLRDLTGKVTYEASEPTSSAHTLQIGHIPDGTYILTIQNGLSTHHKKIVKK